MASIRKWKTGYRAEIARRGVRMSKVFPTKQAAKDWAARQEYAILNADKVAAETPFSEVLDRYAREVSPGKRGYRWEAIRLAKLAQDTLARKSISSITAGDLADWRDRRLREVSAASVRREMTLIGSVLTQARKEWGMISASPMADVRRPAEPAARDRLVKPGELERLRHVAGEDLAFAQARAFHAFLFALETAMRAGEIVGLTRDRVDLQRRVAHLPMTKNGSARSVPLSSEAVRLIEALPPLEPLFGLTVRQLDALWRKARDKAGVENLTFHDSRATATTRIARKVDVLTLAKITGHRDIRMLMVYYRETAEDIAKRLD